jgi:hypothetical protein
MHAAVRYVLGAFIVAGFVWFFSGIALFPDAPIRKCASGYCGKQGQSHTERDYERFQVWETGLKFGWPLVIASMWWLGRRRSNGEVE